MNIKNILKSQQTYLILAIIAGIALRFYGLDLQSYWYDELYTVTVASYKSLLRILSHCLLLDVNPPLYIFFLHFWIKIFGDTELALRMPSAIAGAGSILAVYFLTGKIIDKKTAVFTTIFTALSGWGLYYSQEARSYGILLLLSVIVTLLWLDLIKNLKESGLSRKTLFFYGITAITISYLHYYGTIVIFFQMLYMLFSSIWYKKDIAKVIATGSIIAIFLVIWMLPHYFYMRLVTGGNFWIKKPDFLMFLRIVDMIFSKYLVIPLFLPLLINIKQLTKNAGEFFNNFKPDSLVFSLLYIIIMPILLVILISQSTPMIYYRYFLVFQFPLFLLTSILMLSITFFNSLKGFFFFLTLNIAGLILFIAPPDNLNDIKFYYAPHKQDWIEISKYISENLDEKTIFLVDRLPRFYKYYLYKYIKSPENLSVRSVQDEKLKYSWVSKNYTKLIIAVEHRVPAEVYKKMKYRDCSEFKEKIITGKIYFYECSFKK